MTEETFTIAEVWLRGLVDWLRLGVEAIGALVVAIGIAAAVWQFFRGLGAEERRYARLRLTFARYLALALEFQLAADILSTAISPTWDRIGKLAAIATIRTLLNVFLSREIATEARQVAGERSPADAEARGS